MIILFDKSIAVVCDCDLTGLDELNDFCNCCFDLRCEVGVGCGDTCPVFLDTESEELSAGICAVSKSLDHIVSNACNVLHC